MHHKLDGRPTMSDLTLHARSIPCLDPRVDRHLVILHGLLGSCDNWQTLGKRYAESHHVWLLDARNHGRSPHHPEHSYSAMAADVVRFLDQNHISKACFLGHSMGGKTVLQLSQDHPNRMEKLVVADIAARAYTPHHGPIFDALRDVRPQQATTREEVRDQLASQLGSDPVLVSFLMKGLHRQKEGGFSWRFNVPALQQSLEEVVGSIDLSVNTLPALFIRGSESDYVGDDDLERLQEHFLHMNDHVISGAGHWLHAQAPEEFYAVTSDFLG